MSLAQLVFASQNAFASEMRVKMNTGAFGMDFSATGTDRFYLLWTESKAQRDFTIGVNGSAAGRLVSGAAFASVFKMRSLIEMVDQRIFPS